MIGKDKKMKKILILLMIVFFGILNIQPVNASPIGVVKFNVDTYKDGYAGGVTVNLCNKNDQQDSVSFNMDEYGNTWTYFVNPGEYYITVICKYKGYDIQYDQESFTLNGDDEHTCDITITKQEGTQNSDDEEYVEDLGHIAHKDSSSSKSKKESNNKSDEKNTEQSAKKDGTSSIFAILALVGLVIAAIGILVGLIIIKRRG